MSLLAFLPRVLLTTLILAAGWKTVHQLIGYQIFETVPTVEGLQEALRWDAQDPKSHFQLGVLYRDRLANHDLEKAQAHLEKAVDLNPYSWQYWLELGSCYELSRRLDDAEQAYLKALNLNLRAASYRWRLANFYVRTGKLNAVLEQLRVALILDPSYRKATLKLLWKLGAREAEIEPIWPLDQDSQLVFLHFLVKQDGDARFVAKHWTDLLKGPHPLSLDQGVFYIDHLLRKDRHEAVRTHWIHLMQANGLEDMAFRQKENLIWNGAFELPVSSQGLGWRISSSPAFSIVQAEKGLRIDFSGTQNTDFSGIWQVVMVDAGAIYELSLRFRSEDISTEQGVYLEVVDGRTGALLLNTEPILGSKPWQSYSGRFRVPSGTQLLSIRSKRRLSRRIDNLLRGTLWLDTVLLRRL